MLFGARNGERLVIMPTGAMSPSPPTVYIDALDSVAHANTAGVTHFYDARQSDDGTRFLIERIELRDRQFNLVGRTALPDTSYYANSAVLAPDGRRAYVLAYPNDVVGNTSTRMPKVVVFDTSTSGGGDFAILGEIGLLHFPSCTYSSWNSTCTGGPRMAISPDGATLVLAGDQHVVVVPIPSGLVSPALVPRAAAAGSRRPVMQRLSLSGPAR